MAGEVISGTVTFLFTDLVGSTSMWEREPAAMAAAVALHDNLIRAAVASANGHVFATTGDGYAAVFSRADAAVDAAVGAQHAMATTTWPTSEPLSMRVGLHTGEADERDGDYFGPAVNRAARIMGLAVGGQILVSSLTAELAHGVAFIDIGERHLRGLHQPVRLAMVDSPGLVTDAPPTAVIEGNLPRPATEYVGDLSSLCSRLGLGRGARLITLTGTGGGGQDPGSHRSGIDRGVRLSGRRLVRGPRIGVRS